MKTILWEVISKFIPFSHQNTTFKQIVRQQLSFALSNIYIITTIHTTEKIFALNPLLDL